MGTILGVDNANELHNKKLMYDWDSEEGQFIIAKCVDIVKESRKETSKYEWKIGKAYSLQNKTIKKWSAKPMRIAIQQEMKRKLDDLIDDKILANKLTNIILPQANATT